MTKLNISIQTESQKKFDEKHNKIHSFLKKNFILEKEGNHYSIANLYSTTDRNKVLQLVKGLKLYGFFQNDESYLEYKFQAWGTQCCVEHTKVKEMEALCFTRKSIVPSGRKAMASYITISKSEDVYIVAIAYKSCYKTTRAKNFSTFQLSSDFTGTISFASAWSSTVFSVYGKHHELKAMARMAAGKSAI